MPNGPSRNALTNTVDIYPFVPVYDADGGVIFSQSYANSPDFATVPCSIQEQMVTRDDGMGRVSTFFGTYVEFGAVASGFALKVEDKLVGNGRTLFVDGILDGAGKGRSFRVVCSERV